MAAVLKFTAGIGYVFTQQFFGSICPAAFHCIKTNRADAVKAANELLPQINRDSSISSRMEYLSRIAELKNLIPKNDLKIADVWDRYLNSASRPDSGEKTLAFYQTAFEIFKNWLHKNHSEMIFVRQIDSEIANEFAFSKT